MQGRQVAVVLVAQVHGIGQAGLPHALLPQASCSRDSVTP
jgi:chemotaxis receptor (MCP) glutamine deamidase CheD